jgi:hypothetical protein
MYVGTYPRHDQGDQMCQRQSRQKCSLIHILAKLIRNFYRGKSSQIIWATYVSIFLQKVPKENSHPIGENSPNLTTLTLTIACMYMCGYLSLFEGKPRKKSLPNSNPKSPRKPTFFPTSFHAYLM